MKHKALGLLVAALCLGTPTLVHAETPPKIPGKTYFQTRDGCGFLVDDAALASADEKTRQSLQQRSESYWIGTCQHGLVDGDGFWYDPSPDAIFLRFYDEVRVLGEDPFRHTALKVPHYAVRLPNKHASGLSSTAGTIEYQVFDYEQFATSGKTPIQTAGFPVIWKESLRSTPVFNLNDGSEGDDVKFDFSGTLPDGEAYEHPMSSLSFEAAARSCDDVKVKIKGCSPPGGVFDVYGIFISGLANAGVGSFESRFIPCPNPRTSAGCDATWERSVGKYIDAMQAHARMVAGKVIEQNEQWASMRKSAEDALPVGWKQHWANNKVNRDAVDTALRCREISDFGPISLADAEYIQNKYSSPPCNSAVVAQAVLDRVATYIQAENRTLARRMKQIDDLEKYNRERAQSRSEAWAGFFNSINAVLQFQLQVQQQRPDAANAVATTQTPSAPAYQAIGQPGTSTPQSYDPGKVQTRKVHKPELDAASCVKRAALASGDPLSSFGSQVFSNQCSQTVEVFWCKIGDECERVSGGSVTLAPGKSWPVSAGDYHYGACFGANSGGLVRDANGVNTGRYACTGP